eukprot:scaffold25204_cov193-Amphora_coffeaeformis.AAC.1
MGLHRLVLRVIMTIFGVTPIYLIVMRAYQPVVGTGRAFEENSPQIGEYIMSVGSLFLAICKAVSTMCAPCCLWGFRSFITLGQSLVKQLLLLSTTSIKAACWTRFETMVEQLINGLPFQ